MMACIASFFTVALGFIAQMDSLGNCETHTLENATPISIAGGGWEISFWEECMFMNAK